ncbi:TPA: hypothetical protein DEA21_04500 [Candidatus Uhrbacteria bacterium]|nr:hypothetical protein [Candidatus Uhrbacteria bacterium]HCU32174.1 hypothetical protein [Candidatus Uhrbacteria bacterium]
MENLKNLLLIKPAGGFLTFLYKIFYFSFTKVKPKLGSPYAILLFLTGKPEISCLFLSKKTKPGQDASASDAPVAPSTSTKTTSTGLIFGTSTVGSTPEVNSEGTWPGIFSIKKDYFLLTFKLYQKIALLSKI